MHLALGEQTRLRQLPLGVLKDGRPQFSPSLPPDRLAAIKRPGFGWFEKVFLRFEDPFWRISGRPHLMVYPRDPTQSTIWFLGLDAFGDAPTLAAFIFHGRLLFAGEHT